MFALTSLKWPQKRVKKENGTERAAGAPQNSSLAISQGAKMVMNSFEKRNFMQPMRRLSMHP